MHLKGLERSFEGIKTAETRKRAGGMIREAFIRYEGFELPCMQGEVPLGVPAPSVILGVPEAVEGGVSVGECQVSFSEGRPAEAARMVEIYKGNPVLEPITDSDWEVRDNLEGVADGGDRPFIETPVAMIGGWPERAGVVISGLAPNRRHLRGTLPDGRVVTVERTMAKEWKGGQTVTCRLIRAGAAPLFRVA